MVPKILPQTSFDACILRAILSVQSCGTWQSGQVARTPERLVKWIVASAPRYTLSRISWQPMQNVSVLVSSSAVLKPPQKMTPRDEAAERQEAEAEIRGWAGESVRHARSSERRQRQLIARHPRVSTRRLEQLSMSWNVLATSGCASVCATWHCVQK